MQEFPMKINDLIRAKGCPARVRENQLLSFSESLINNRLINPWDITFGKKKYQAEFRTFPSPQPL